MIRKTEAIDPAQITGKAIFTFDPSGHASQDLEALMQKVLHHG